MRCSLAEKGKTMRLKYDQEYLKTPEGKSLWMKWRNGKQAGMCSEWSDFDAFKAWALEHNFSQEAMLKKYNPDFAHSPDNSYFRVTNNEGNRITPEQVEKWNETVNRIRVHYGMKPLSVNEEIEDAERT